MKKTTKEQLQDNIARRIKLVYKGALTQFERNFPSLMDSDEWSRVRYNVLNIGNDQVRLVESDLRDYRVDKGISASGGRVNFDVDSLGILSSIQFGWHQGSKPYIKIDVSDENHNKILDGLRDEIGIGVISRSESKWVYYIMGIEDCVNVLPFFDKLLFIKEVSKEYPQWREEVVQYFLWR